MKSRSANEKGKRFEKAVAALVTQMGLGLAKREAGSGNGQFKGDIAWSLKKTPELKNQPAKFPKILIDWIEQSESQDLGHQGWVLILRDPRKAEAALQGFAVLDMHQYLELELAAMAPKTENPDRDFKYAIDRLIRCTTTVMRLAEDRDTSWKFQDLKMACREVLKRLSHL